MGADSSWRIEKGSEILTSKASVFGANAKEHMPAAKVKVLEDTTGAGDS